MRAQLGVTDENRKIDRRRRAGYRQLVRVTSLAVPAAAQEGLSQAKALYASASYEEALQALGTTPGRTATVRSTEVAVYQVFCLLALGRSGEATQAIEAIVHTDPMFHPTDSQASPRLRTFFEDARRPLLPEIVRADLRAREGRVCRKQADRGRRGFCPRDRAH